MPRFEKLKIQYINYMTTTRANSIGQSEGFFSETFHRFILNMAHDLLVKEQIQGETHAETRRISGNMGKTTFAVTA